MLMPTLSVTVLGLVAAAIVCAGGRAVPVRAFAGGVAGAWAGFLCGALAGLVIDIVTGRGVLLAVLGHGAALVGGLIGAGRLGLTGAAPAPRPEDPRRRG